MDIIWDTIIIKAQTSSVSRFAFYVFGRVRLGLQGAEKGRRVVGCQR